MDAFKNSKRGVEAQAYLDRMISRGIYPDHITVGTLLNAYKYSGQWEQGLRSWTSLRQLGMPLHSAHISIFVDMCGFSTKLDVMEQELTDLKSEGVLFGEDVFCGMVEAYAKNGQFRQAGGVLFKIMPAQEVRPSARAAKTLITALRDRKKFNEAARVRDALLELYPDLVDQLTMSLSKVVRWEQANRLKTIIL